MTKCYDNGALTCGACVYRNECRMKPIIDGGMVRIFYDIEQDIIYSEDQLRSEYENFKMDIYESSGAATFEEHIINATSKNGFLEEIK
jgi:hypothetical protein